MPDAPIQVADSYRHAQKRTTYADALVLRGAWLKWYDLAAEGAAPKEELRERARAYVGRIAAQTLGLTGDAGFVILHRCGGQFTFLLISVWRGNNELWEAVHYIDAGMDDFAPFAPATPALGQLRPTFCVWELGIVAHEVGAWNRYLASPRNGQDYADWQRDHFTGTV